MGKTLGKIFLLKSLFFQKKIFWPQKVIKLDSKTNKNLMVVKNPYGYFLIYFLQPKTLRHNN